MNARTKMKQLKTNQSRLDKMKSVKIIIPNLLAEQHHTVLYGASGSMKSSIAASMLLKLPSQYELDYWGFDVNISFKIAFMRIVHENGLEDKVNLFEDVTVQDFYNSYTEVIQNKERLENIIIVIDTYKFLTKDVNDKRANTKALHFFKQLLSLGATFLSLAHTNKDGENMSGTAELEQDTDAVFRIDAIDKEDKKIATIKQAGRVRFRCEGDISFEAPLDTSSDLSEEDRWYSLLTGIKKLDKTLDVEKEVRQVILEAEDESMIKLIQSLLEEAGGSLNQSELIKKVLANDECNIGDNKLKLLIPRYKDIHWIIQKTGAKKRTNKVTLIDKN